MKIRRLNSLRSLAVLIVLVSHYSNESGIWGGILGHGAGQFGVMLFFLLSSFLMSYLYLDKTPSKDAVHNYVVARVARVIPLFLVVVLICFAINQLQLNTISPLVYSISSFKELMMHLLFLHGEGVLWTIPPEIHFYILFACIWLLRPHLGKSVFLIPLLVLVVYCIGIWPSVVTINFFGATLPVSILLTLPYFIVGILLGYTFHHWQAPQRLCNHWFVLSLFLIPLLYPMIFSQMTGYSHGLWQDPGVLAAVSIIFFMVVFLVPSGNLILENKIGDKLGEISYSLYLLHHPLLLLLKKCGLVSGIGGLVLFMIVSVAAAWISFILLESPLRKKIRAMSISG